MLGGGGENSQGLRSDCSVILRFNAFEDRVGELATVGFWTGRANGGFTRINNFAQGVFFNW